MESLSIESNKTNSDKFYNISQLLSFQRNYNIFFCLGGRNIGKSTAWQKHFIHEAITKQKKIGFIVRRKAHIQLRAKGYYDDNWFQKWYPDYEYQFKKDKMYIKKKTSDQWFQFGYVIVLGDSDMMKSIVSMQDIDTLVFEEVMPLDENSYIKNSENPYKECKLLEAIYQTISRGTKGKQTRKVNMILISNLYTMNNPYFLYFNIMKLVQDSKDGLFKRFYKYDKGHLHYVVEFSQLQSEATGIETSDEALGFKFQDYRHELHYTKDKPKKVFLQLTFDGNYIINIANYNDTFICYEGKETIDSEKVLNYSCSKYRSDEYMGIKVFENTQLYRIINNLYEKNELIYDKLETYMQLTNILLY